ncbi:MAG: triose-phosphate isomerase [Rhizobiales bacterium]|nr:triose-phosphate isomerase [Hyphomicrobiales bacterium]
MHARKPLVVGNWKMNGVKASAAEFGRIAEAYRPELRKHVQLVVCPPTTLLSTFAVIAVGSRVAIGAQDCHPGTYGAHTGDISAEMVADAGATFVIVGHSERRIAHRESDADAAGKVRAVHDAGLISILCVGETAEERRSGQALAVIDGQLDGSMPEGIDLTADDLVIAYEPVWAIGTGVTPSLDDIAEMHDHIRARLGERLGAEGARMHILYGGSVKPSNAAEILSLPDVNGALVGGASLKAEDFLGIASVYS